MGSLWQAGVFVFAGLWPVFHIKSFEAVTGPKADRWLVKTVGLLLASIGSGIALANYRGRSTQELKWIAQTSALSLLAIDLVYVSKRRISSVYLLDALLQAFLISRWKAKSGFTPIRVGRKHSPFLIKNQPRAAFKREVRPSPL